MAADQARRPATILRRCVKNRFQELLPLIETNPRLEAREDSSPRPERVLQEITRHPSRIDRSMQIPRNPSWAGAIEIAAPSDWSGYDGYPPPTTTWRWMACRHNLYLHRTIILDHQPCSTMEPIESSHVRSHTRFPPYQSEIWVVVGDERKCARLLNASYGGIGVMMEMADAANVPRRRSVDGAP